MATSRIKITKGNEFQQIENYLNQLFDLVNSNSNQNGNLKPEQKLATVIKPDGSPALQIRDAKGIKQVDLTVI